MINFRKEVYAVSDNQKDKLTQWTEDDIARFETIEFSQEDLKRLRQPNPRPLDLDYFDQPASDLGQAPSDQSVPEMEGEVEVTEPEDLLNPIQEEEYLDEEPPLAEAEEILSTEGVSSLINTEESTQDLETVFSTNDAFSDEQTSEVENQLRLGETLELEIDPSLYHRHDFEETVEEEAVSEEAEEANPFVYRSIEPQLRQEQLSKRAANVKPGFFQRMMQTVFSTRDDLLEGDEESLPDLDIDYYDQPEELDSLAIEQENEDIDQVELEPLQDLAIHEVEEVVDCIPDGSDSLKERPEDLEKSETELSTVEAASRDSSENDDEFLLVEDSQELETQLRSELSEGTEEISLDEKDLEPLIEKEVSYEPEVVTVEKEPLDFTGSDPKTKMYDEEELDALTADLFVDQEDSMEAESPELIEAKFSDRIMEATSAAWHKFAEKSSGFLQKTKEKTSKLLTTVQDKLSEEDSRDNEQEIDIADPDSQKVEESQQVDEIMDELNEKNESTEDHKTNSVKESQRPILVDSVLEDTFEIPLHDLQSAQELNTEISEQSQKDQDKKGFVSGAAWLTFGQVFSRVIGALYVIPWATWLGNEYSQANSLFAIGYNSYIFFLSCAIAGFPGAVAKQIAYFHTKKEYRIVEKIFRNALIMMLISGVIISIVFYFIAPTLASSSPTDNQAAAVTVIRSLAPALLVLPTLSLFKGYFQGYSEMFPLALSEIIEQVVRVAYMLGATFVIMKIYQGQVTQAVAHSTFAAFVGAVVSLLFLLVVYFLHRRKQNRIEEKDLDLSDIDFKTSVGMMIHDAIPFIILGSGIVIAQNIDTYTFKQILVRTSVLLNTEIAELFGAMSLDVNKLVMIVVSLAVAMAASSIPAVSSKFAEGDINKTSDLIKNIILLFAFIMLPASVGMALIADNIYPFFYPAGIEAGPSILITGSLTAIVLGSYTVMATILQSMNHRRAAMTYLGAGLGIKLLLQFPMVALFHAHGALLATFFAFAVVSVLMWVKIWKMIKIRDRYFVGDLVRIVIATVIMGIGTFAWNRLLNHWMDPVGRGLTFLQIVIVVVISILIYGAIMALFGMLSIVIGDYRADLQKKMSMHL